MSDAESKVARAMKTPDPAAADRLLLEAVCIDPELGVAYGLRGRLAVARGDAVAAAHHFRVAYARGDRADETRVGLALCLAAIGQVDLAERVRENLALPPGFEELSDDVAAAHEALRRVLAAPLPPRGTPALLPGERPVSATETRPTAAGIRTVTLAPLAAPASLGQVTDPARERRPVEPASTAPPPVPAEVTPPPSGRRLPDWVDHIERPLARPPASNVGPSADWIEDSTVRDVRAAAPYPAGRGGPIAIELGPSSDEAFTIGDDPGEPAMTVRSPVTGRAIRPQDVSAARVGSRMPEMDRRVDLLEQARAFERLDGARLHFAVEVPGPVLTAPGIAPRPLCKRMAFAASDQDLLFRDLDRADVPLVRLTRAQLSRIDVLNDETQATLTLRDGRQIHVDLRSLVRHHPPTARVVVKRIVEFGRLVSD